MHEIDFLPVGDGARSGDAIAMRFTRPDNGDLAHAVIDGGFTPDGEALVEHVKRLYGVDYVDLVVLTHPDEDHINGIPKVLEGLGVGALLIHDLNAHGGGSLRAARAVRELRESAASRGTNLYEPFAGLQAFGGALVVAGPSESYYEELVEAQVIEERSGARPGAASATLRAAALSASALSGYPAETPFADAGGTNPRNNSSAIIDIQFGEQRFLFAGDAGVPALEDAAAYLLASGRAGRPPTMVQVPHHGSRHNADSGCLDRLLGTETASRRGSALISISAGAAADPRYPSPRTTNAYGRRGYPAFCTAGSAMCLSSEDAPARGWTTMSPLPPLDESIDERP